MSADEFRNYILGFIFISPNFGINHKLANLITWPLSKYWLSLIIGKTTKSKARNDLNAKYWTLAYPTNALIPMANLVKKVNEQDFSNVKIPALFYFSLDDKVVRPDKTIQFIKNYQKIDAETRPPKDWQRHKNTNKNE